MMHYTSKYHSPLGNMLLAADEIGLTGVWFEGQKYFAQKLSSQCLEKETPILQDTKCWLDQYFAGTSPDFTPSVHLIGTPFQVEVWNLLMQVPYGQTMSYGQIAARLAQKRGVPHMSAQAVGGAVGHNPISLIVPCHRVLGVNKRLTGYAGGIDKKLALLDLEGIDTSDVKHPK